MSKEQLPDDEELQQIGLAAAMLLGIITPDDRPFEERFTNFGLIVPMGMIRGSDGQDISAVEIWEANNGTPKIIIP